MAKFQKGHQHAFKPGQSGNPSGKSKVQAEAEVTLRERLAKLASDGVSPVEMMLITARDLWRDANPEGKPPILAKRMQAVAIAEKAAPYLHPKLAATQMELGGGKDGAPIVVTYMLPDNGR